MFLTAPLGHRRNTRVFLYCGRAGETLALFTKGNQQPGRQRRAGTGQCAEQTSAVVSGYPHPSYAKLSNCFVAVTV